MCHYLCLFQVMDSVVIHGSLGPSEVLSLWLPVKADTSTRILRDIYTVPKPIRHNPDVSLPLFISGHGFCDYPWLSRSEGGPFSLAMREGLTLVLGFWELYIL